MKPPAKTNPVIPGEGGWGYSLFCRGVRCLWSWRILWAVMSPAWGTQRCRPLWSKRGSALLEWPHEAAAGSSSHCGAEQANKKKDEAQLKIIALIIVSFLAAGSLQSPQGTFIPPGVLGLSEEARLKDQSASGILLPELRGEEEAERRSPSSFPLTKISLVRTARSVWR